MLSSVSEPPIEDLPRDARLVVARVFLGRAEAEARAARNFALVRDALMRLDAEPVLVEMATRAIGEEEAHARICLGLAVHYAGQPLQARNTPLPPFELASATPRLRAILFVLGSCAISETIGDAFLARMLAETRAPLVRDALRRLMTDEIDHARIGWGLLASRTIDDATRAEIGGWLPTLCEIGLNSWRARPELPSIPLLREHGCLPWEEVDAVVVETFSTLILPGFAALGIDTQHALAWAARIAKGAAPAKLDLHPIAS